MAKGERYLKHTPYVPYDPNCSTYCQSEGGMITPFEAGGFHPYEYEGWIKECLSWHTSCYLHAGLNPTNTYRLKGPDVLKLLSDISVNSFKKFEVGSSKHVIMCNEEGYIVIHGAALRLAEDEVLTFWLWPYIEFALKQGNYDVVGENLTGKVFLYQLGGPRSLEVVEAAAGEDLHDIKFLRFKNTRIDGREVMVYRIGMCGTLAYEVHGKVEDAIPVYNALLKAGEPFGITKLGRHAYRVVHTEGGFPQVAYHFFFANREGLDEFMANHESDIYGFRPPVLKGSMDPDIKLHLRNPVEVGWAKMINFDHDFIGKEALQKIVANPKRKMVTLEWNPEDILDIYRSWFDPDEEPYSFMEFRGEGWAFYNGGNEYHADAVLNKDGKVIGISSGRMFSPYYRKMISLCSIDVEYGEIGTEVTILWGEKGTKQKEIRATVARFPYVDKDRNEDVDTETIPRLKDRK
ncbi:hypothetical protein [Moorella sp. E306M]|uniref:hypothetical protein n=1 Tax=Moorella sp. E306M TaxID=2572683 RepID=UPI0010FFAAA5|nr:hypothetical protein [Moorella sp. E306M]GEA17029.1 hypothetical protein E306M_01630 [Moorella sp. E306M]